MATVMMKQHVALELPKSPFLNSRSGEYWVVTVEIGGYNTLPEFAVTADVYPGTAFRHERAEASGMMHKEIAKYFPQLMPLLKWHGWNIAGSMHYIANSTYWLGWNGGWRDQKPGSPAIPNGDIFAHHVNWGLLPGEGDIPREWFADKHELLLNHADGFCKDGGMSWYLRDNKSFAEYIKPYIAEQTSSITKALENRLPGVIALMLGDLEAFFQAHKREAGAATAAMHTRLR